jgi:hypothetical protein
MDVLLCFDDTLGSEHPRHQVVFHGLGIVATLQCFLLFLSL